MLWDGEHVAALLDLEWSRPSWIHAEILLSVAAEPALFAAADYDAGVVAADCADIPRWLAAARPARFAHPRLRDRLDVLRLSHLGHFEDPLDHEFRWDQVRALVRR